MSCDVQHISNKKGETVLVKFVKSSVEQLRLLSGFSKGHTHTP